jgi:hypothetical protein
VTTVDERTGGTPTSTTTNKQKGITEEEEEEEDTLEHNYERVDISKEAGEASAAVVT